MPQGNKLQVILTMLDKATAPLRAFQSRVNAVGASMRAQHNAMRLGITTGPATDMLNSAYALGASLKSIGVAAAGVRSSFRGVTGELRNIATTGVIAGGALGWLFKTQLIDTAADFEKMNAQLRSLEKGDIKKAEKDFKWITDFAENTTLQFDEVMKGFIQLRTNGLDPMDGTMQAITDAMAQMGGGMEVFSRITVQLGQAWNKQKLQGQDVIAIINNGIPVWDLLEKASKRGGKAVGHTAKEFAEMATKGRLGRDTIRVLIHEIGEFAKGASAAQMKTWNGMMSNLMDKWTIFKNMVMQSGAFEYMKGKARALLNILDTMAKNGELKKWAEYTGAKLKEFVEDFYNLVVNDLWPALKKIASEFKKAADKMGGWGNLLKVFAALYFTPLILAVGQFSLAIALLGKNFGITLSSMAGSFRKFATFMLTNPVGIALGLLTVAAILLYRNWDGVVGGLKIIWGQLGDIMDWVIAKVEKVLGFSPTLTALVKTLLNPGAAIAKLVVGDMSESPVARTPASRSTSTAPLRAALSLPTFDVGALGAPLALPATSPAQQVTKTNNAKVTVDFQNVPQGLRVTTDTKGRGAPLDLSMGYAMPMH